MRIVATRRWWVKEMEMKYRDILSTMDDPFVVCIFLHRRRFFFSLPFHQASLPSILAHVYIPYQRRLDCGYT